MPLPVPHAAITFHPDTGSFGFSVWFPGKCPHYVMETFTSEESARNWIDPLAERVWEHAPPEAGNVIAVSRAYKPGSVRTRL